MSSMKEGIQWNIQTAKEQCQTQIFRINNQLDSKMDELLWVIRQPVLEHILTVEE